MKMPAPDCVVVDFETEAIAPRPKYPPVPVGFSIKQPGGKTQYYAWGHISHNNCTKAKAQQVLRGAWRGQYPLLFQNAKFDYDVAVAHMGMPKLPWESMHDTLYLLFLENPYATSLSLKPSAERILKMRSSERDDLMTWIVNNIPEAKRKPSSWGAYIARAPGNIVGRYADGDILRTEKLFTKLYPLICKRGMLQAYDRERHLMPYLLLNEQTGVRVDLRKLERDVLVYQAALDKTDQWLRHRLGVKDLNLDADRDVGEALDRTGVVTQWTPTKTGKKSVAKKNMTLDRFNDVQVASAYAYRNMLRTCLSMFMEPWLEVARQTNGIIYTTWNQVRQSHNEKKSVGARTGRLSSTPNFQNVPKNWEKAVAEGYVHPAFLNVPPLPLMRQYFLPDSREHLWGRRDYNQQELRILAHFEDGSLLQEYNANPRLDIHNEVQDAVLEVVGIKLSRGPTKILNFADIYGRGIGTLAESMKVTVEIAKQLRKVKDVRFPDVKQLMASVKERGKAGLPIRTWGGREYYTEPAKYSEKYGREMSFEYKLLNYLIQGSASECTKESIIRYHEHPKAGPRTGDARFLITVHDENNISGHKRVFAKEMAVLREVMQSVEFDTPMLSDGEAGPNWGHMKKFKEPEFVAAKAVAASA